VELNGVVDAPRQIHEINRISSLATLHARGFALVSLDLGFEERIADAGVTKMVWCGGWCYSHMVALLTQVARGYRHTDGSGPDRFQSVRLAASARRRFLAGKSLESLVRMRTAFSNMLIVLLMV
jgi:hypothetical protein